MNKTNSYTDRCDKCGKFIAKSDFDKGLVVVSSKTELNESINADPNPKTSILFTHLRCNT